MNANVEDHKEICVFSQAEEGQTPSLSIDFTYTSLVKGIKVFNPAVAIERGDKVHKHNEKVSVKVGDTDCAFIDSELNNNILTIDCKGQEGEEWPGIKGDTITFTGVPYS